MTQDVEQPIIDRQAGQRHLERLVMLSDGIFAIAITLSAIEIRPEQQDGASLWQAWAVPLAIYFLSFFLIGQVWMVHRRIVSHLRDIDGPGTVINMLLLSLVALVPVVVRFTITHPSQGQAVIVYALSFVITYGCMALLWAYVAFIARLAPELPRAAARELLFKLVFAVVLCAAAMLYLLGSLVGACVFGLAAAGVRWLAWRQGRRAATVP